MSNFSVDIVNDTLVIKCDTYWSCKCEGNIMLSKYSGIGDDIIELLNHEEMKYHEGYVYFTYGDERCEYPYKLVQYRNDCITIDTMPMWTLCNDEKTKVLFFNYKHETDTFRFKVHPPNVEYEYDEEGKLIKYDKGWDVVDDGGHVYFYNDNEVLLVANTDKDFVIGATGCEDKTKHIYIKLTNLTKKEGH